MRIGRYLIVFVFIMSLIITFGKRGVIDNYAMKEQLSALKKTNHDLVLENRDLKKTIMLMRSDLQYIEVVARNDLGMVRKGDLVYRYQTR
ncbi:MAG: septum formation initiator family protein [Deltaproteobacteria bacterium]|nr:septum formation initiator family protein [Deltaproteobacteria bacterium]